MEPVNLAVAEKTFGVLKKPQAQIPELIQWNKICSSSQVCWTSQECCVTCAMLLAGGYHAEGRSAVGGRCPPKDQTFPLGLGLSLQGLECACRAGLQ